MSLEDDARELVEESRREERRSRKVQRRPDPRITDLRTHPKKWVNFSVAAEFLEMDRRALAAYADEGHIAFEWKGRRRKIHLDELARFTAWLKARAHAS